MSGTYTAKSLMALNRMKVAANSGYETDRWYDQETCATTCMFYGRYGKWHRSAKTTYGRM